MAAYTFAALSSIEVRDALVKNGSQLRIANERPTSEAPAFMISGREPLNGFGLARSFLSLMY